MCYSMQLWVAMMGKTPFLTAFDTISVALEPEPFVRAKYF